jgi:DNA-binding PadR family transcriptional regulator
MKLPGLSHLQFAVLGALLAEEQRGRELRRHLAQLRVRHSGPAFYQMMSRLEDAGLIEGWYTQKVVGGQIIKERRYAITAAGRRAWQEARAFYLELIRVAGAKQGLANA